MDIADHIVRFCPSTLDIVDEDVLFYHECFKIGADTSDSNPNWWYYAICDGHNGHAAASFVRDNFDQLLIKRLPKTLPKELNSSEGLDFARSIELALILVFDELDYKFRQQCVLSGTTLTVVLIVKSLVTICNVGDTYAFVQSGGKSYPMTVCHRIEDNKKERERLEKAGVFVAGLRFDGGTPTSEDDTYGPARAWPAGITLSRTIGDIDAPDQVICRPYIKQAVLYDGGARIIMASDGLWDILGQKRVLGMAKKIPWDKLADQFVYMLSSGGQATDDATIAIIDIMPRHLKHLSVPNHPNVVSKLRCFGLAEKNVYIDIVYEVDTLGVDNITIDNILEYRKDHTELADSVRDISQESDSTTDDDTETMSSLSTSTPTPKPVGYSPQRVTSSSKKKKMKNVYNVADKKSIEDKSSSELSRPSTSSNPRYNSMS